jgi:hypothetical protein
MADEPKKTRKPGDDSGKAKTRPKSDAAPKKAGPPEPDGDEPSAPMGGMPPLPFGPPAAARPPMPAGGGLPEILGSMMGGAGGPPSLAASPAMPVGGSLPPGGDTAGSPLLAALASSLSDPFAAPGPDPVDLNVGPQDPNMGLMDLLGMLGLSAMGVGGGGARAGQSGVPTPPFQSGVTGGF